MAASCGVVKKIQASHILSPTMSEWTSAYRLSDSFSSHAWPVPWLDLEDAIYSAFAAGLTDSDDVMGKAQQRVKAGTCWDLFFMLGTFNHGHVWRVVEQRLLETNTGIIGCWRVWYFMNCVRHATGTDLLKILTLPSTPGTSRHRESPARCAGKHGLPRLKFLLDGVGNLLEHRSIYIYIDRSSQRPGS